MAPIYEGGLFKGLQFTTGAYLKDSNSRGGPILSTPIYAGGLFKGLLYEGGLFEGLQFRRGAPISGDWPI